MKFQVLTGARFVCGCVALLFAGQAAADGNAPSSRVSKGIWISREELASLPAVGPAWKHLKEFADRPLPPPDLKDQDQKNNVAILAKAYVFGRTGIQKYRDEVCDHCMQIIGTEQGGRTLALGRKLSAYVIAADLVSLAPDDDARFQDWLRHCMAEELEGQTLRETHERRPNNWGTHAGAARAAVALYLDDREELERTAVVFKGYLGDRASYAGFKFGELSWQSDSMAPVGVNPRGAVRDGHSIDGALPEEMRRGGEFQWPPQPTGYPWEALQGALVQAEILHRAGFDTWEWEDRALLRAVEFLNRMGWAAKGDDQWIPWLINCRYGTTFPTKSPAGFGKSMGWTDWTHAKSKKPRETRG